jgi:hypothetical protein
MIASFASHSGVMTMHTDREVQSRRREIEMIFITRGEAWTEHSERNINIKTPIPMGKRVSKTVQSNPLKAVFRVVVAWLR